MNLQLHAGGRKDHQKNLLTQLRQQIQIIKASLRLSSKEKETKIKELKNHYQKEKAQTRYNHY